MFAKPYKHKSNNTLKNSEKKQLVQRILTEFPSASEEKIKELVPVKSSTSCMRLVLHNGDTVGVFVVEGRPMLIEVGERLVPTVCALWTVPDLIPKLVIHTPVLSKVAGGAPLYAPGVCAESVRGARFGRGALVSACTAEQAAAALVGRAAMASADLLHTSMGVCVEVLHVLGDLLCKEPKFSKIERPKLGPPTFDTDTIVTDLDQLNIQPMKEEWPSLVREDPKPAPVVNEPQVIADTAQEPEPAEDITDGDVDLNETITSECETEEDGIPEDMDGLLRWCLLSFLKLQAKNLELPLKTNLLYRNHLMATCPPDRTLDVKKSTYKKMGKFLEAMEREGLIAVREVEKGVDAVVRVQPAHPLLRAHRLPPAPSPPAPAPGPPRHADYRPPAVREMYCITANVADLFAPLKKGTALSASDVRSTLTEYVRARNLQGTAGVLLLDPLLAKVTGRQPQEQMKWEEVMSSVLGRMTPSTEMRFADGSVKLSKTRLEPIKMQVATRSGNKKVTLVSNLESFGFELTGLASACQRGVAASCGLTRSPGARATQLLLQGDQTHFIAKLLIEKYGLPKKFVEGADKALNKKK